MDLHFCSRCGISIPQSEIDAGYAMGAGGKYFCSEHRAGSSAAAGEGGARSATMGSGSLGSGVLDSGATSTATLPGDDPELLFCANCRVSIPQDDSRSGRAHREFGSLLCAGCSKADPGERAARREAVEAEMAADVDAQDPVVARHCSVCSAAVPYSQIVTGRAKVEGNRVVCERCRAASVAAPDDAKVGMSPGLVLVLVILVAGGFGYFATQTYMGLKQADTATNDAVAAMRIEMRTRLDDADRRVAEAARRSEEPDRDAIAARERAAADIDDLRRVVNELRAEMARSDAELSQRLAKTEVEIAALKERFRDLTVRTAPAPAVPAPPVEKAPEPMPPTPQPGGAGGASPKPETPAVDPAVAKLCKDLLESPDDGTRFAAARELTTLKDASAIPSLVKALGDDKHYFVRRGCARALGVMKSWFAVPALIRALEDREVYVALAANIALQNITNNDFGVTQDSPASLRKTKAREAEKWWDKNRERPPEGVSLHPITE